MAVRRRGCPWRISGQQERDIGGCSEQVDALSSQAPKQNNASATAARQIGQVEHQGAARPSAGAVELDRAGIREASINPHDREVHSFGDRHTECQGSSFDLASRYRPFPGSGNAAGGVRRPRQPRARRSSSGVGSANLTAARADAAANAIGILLNSKAVSPDPSLGEPPWAAASGGGTPASGGAYDQSPMAGSTPPGIG
jgi:hypothetical protein